MAFPIYVGEHSQWKGHRGEVRVVMTLNHVGNQGGEGKERERGEPGAAAKRPNKWAERERESK